MKKLATALALVASIAAAAACSDDDNNNGTPGTPTDDAGASSSGSTSGSTSSGGAGDDDDGDDDDDKTDAGKDSGGQTCEAAKATALVPVDKVSDAEVKDIAEADGAKTIYIDAAAGGAPEAAKNPRVYISLETMTRVAVTDVAAPASTDWDLALKRSVFFTNGGDGGKGQGGAQFLADKDFAAVTKADATALKTESFFDAECNPKKDDFGALETSFSGWYDYNLGEDPKDPRPANHLTPFAGTWIVKGATGKLYKLAILTWYAKPDGTPEETSNTYGAHLTIKAAPLE